MLFKFSSFVHSNLKNFGVVHYFATDFVEIFRNMFVITREPPFQISIITFLFFDGPFLGPPRSLSRSSGDRHC